MDSPRVSASAAALGPRPGARPLAQRGVHAAQAASRSSAARAVRPASTAPTAAPAILTTAASPAPTYGGGPLLEGAQVWVVFWGTTVDPDVVAGIGGFFTSVLPSPYLDMLAEYNTTNPAHTIGHGTYMGSYTDESVPAPDPNTSIITDVQIRAELSRLFDSKALPAPTANSVYFLYFGPEVVVDRGGNTLSCNDFCAYHGDFTRNGNNVYYAVEPAIGDGSSPCGYCGDDPLPLNNVYAVTSAQLADAITDAACDTGPDGWEDNKHDAFGNRFGEIGDICNFQLYGTAASYHVQSVWSNAANGCRTAGAATADVMQVTPGEGSLSSATPLVFTVTNSGSAGPLTLGTSDPGPGALALNQVKFSIAPASIASGQSATVTLTAAAGSKAEDVAFWITATDGNGVLHFASPLVHVASSLSPSITSVMPPAGPTHGGTSITISGANLYYGTHVTIGGIAVPSTFAPGVNTVSFTSPSHAEGAVTISVSNANDASAPVTATFTYTAGLAPTLTSIAPTGGPVGGGQLVTVTGTHFSPNMTVSFGGTVVAIDKWLSDSTVLVQTPAHAAGAVDFTVANGDGLSATSAGAYRYGAPYVANVSVSSGPTGGGTYVSILGDNFGAGATVSFGGTAATIQSAGTSFLGVTTPVHQPGAVDVVVSNPGGAAATLTNGFTYVGLPLDMSGLDMANGSQTSDDMAVGDDMAQASQPLGDMAQPHDMAMAKHPTGCSCSFAPGDDAQGPALLLLLAALLVWRRARRARA